jgi:hypothetical protein
MANRSYSTNFIVLNKLTVPLSLSLALLFLESCEGYRCADGIVMDKLTGRPLDSILIEVVTASKHIYTDTSGKFGACNKMAGCA